MRQRSFKNTRILCWNIIDMLKRRDKISNESQSQVNRLVEGTKVVGDIAADSTIFIDGEIVGNVFCRSKVVIGETGKVFGNISCADSDIEGSVDGSLEIEGLLVLRAKSKIAGDILTARLHIEEGALFVGSCHMKGHVEISTQAHIVTSEENSNNSIN
jgi:cytoskeletal protein CcmA (bactofilin family)